MQQEQSLKKVLPQPHRDPLLLDENSSEQQISSVGHFESTVNWIEQDSTSQPLEYLEDCDTRICGE
jgi:Na+-translocating ferredoxin:NAD+ oxidoreductase RnfG subunit